MVDLNPERVGDYFAGEGTVETWWTPDTGPLAFHYDAEVAALDDYLSIDPAWQVLDIGTGRGRFGLHFARSGCSVVGVDANAGMLEAAAEGARQLGVSDRFKLIRGRAEDLGQIEDGAYDLVLCMELFDHLPDAGLVIREMASKLSPSGVLAFTYVPGASLYGAIGNVYRWIQMRRGAGEGLISRTYALNEVERLLAEAGLRLDRYWGVGLLCASAQTRLFLDNPLMRAATALARAESRIRPYHSSPLLARHAAHVVGLARRA